MSAVTEKLKDVVGLGSGNNDQNTNQHTVSGSSQRPADNSFESSLQSQHLDAPGSGGLASASGPSAHQTGHKPSDAAKFPPSVVAQTLGAPTIEHEHPEDSVTKRHSVSHQEQHFMR